jgi:predicted metalloendopeptidase
MDVAAINALGIDPIRPLLADVAAAKDVADLTVLFGRAAKDNLTSPITFVFGVDRENPDRYQFSVGIGGMSLPDRDYYLEDTEKFKETRAAYSGHIVEMLHFADFEGAEAKAKAILAIETQLAEKQWTRSERRNADRTLNPASYAEFKEQYTGFDWDRFFAARDMTSIERLNVSYPDCRFQSHEKS